MTQENLELKVYDGPLTKDSVEEAVRQGKEGTYKHPVIELLNDKIKLFEEYNDRFQEKKKKIDHSLDAQDEEGLFDFASFVDSLENLPDFDLRPLDIIAVETRLKEICPGYYTLIPLILMIVNKFMSLGTDKSVSKALFKDLLEYSHKKKELSPNIEEDEEALKYALQRVKKVENAYNEVVDFMYNAEDAINRMWSGEKLEKYEFCKGKAIESVGENWCKATSTIEMMLDGMLFDRGYVD